MTATAVPAVAVVVASRGGRRLREALAGVAWAAERAVLDPADVVADDVLPPGVVHLRSTASVDGAGQAPWLLLVTEDERVPEPLAAALATSIAEAAAPAAMALGRELDAFGVRLRLAGAAVRLAPRAGGTVRLDRGLGLALAGDAGGRTLAGAALVWSLPSMAEAAHTLDTDTTVLAALLDASGARPRVRSVVAASCAAAWRVLRGHARPPAGLVRWVLAVLHGYRALVAYAKLWERRRARPWETS